MRCLALLLTMVLGSCSPGSVASTRCAKVSSVLSGSTSQGLALLQQFAPHGFRGGYLVVTHRPTPMAAIQNESEAVKTFCAARFYRPSSTPQRVLVWTADHCIDFSRARKIDLYMHKLGENPNEFGEYASLTSPLKLKSLRLERLEELRAQAAALIPGEAANQFFRIFSFDTLMTGTRWCQEFTKANYVESAQQICASIDDMTFFEMTPTADATDADLPPVEKDVISNDYPWKFVNATLGGNGPDARIELYHNLVSKRTRLAHAKMLARLDACVEGSDDVVCASRDALQTLLRSAADLTQYQSESVEGLTSDLVRDSEKLAEFWDWFRDIQNNYQRYLSQSGVPSASDLTFLQGFNFRLAGNYSVSDGPPGVRILDGITLPSSMSYMNLPSYFGLATQETEKKIGSRGILLTAKEGQYRLSMQHGDSGALLSLHLDKDIEFTMPVAIVSTVNGEPTSGGLSMRPVATPAPEGSAGGGGVVDAGGGAPTTQGAGVVAVVRPGTAVNGKSASAAGGSGTSSGGTGDAAPVISSDGMASCGSTRTKE